MVIYDSIPPSLKSQNETKKKSARSQTQRIKAFVVSSMHEADAARRHEVSASVPSTCFLVNKKSLTKHRIFQEFASLSRVHCSFQPVFLI